MKVLTDKFIRQLFSELSSELEAKDIIGELCICGGTVMCLVFKARAATKDVDAIFEPTLEIREAASKVAKKHGLPDDWLNDAVKGFIYTDPPKELVMELSNLRVFCPSAEYMLAMKCVSARFDSSDADDIVFLIDFIGLRQSKDVYKIISRYYPENKIPTKTRFLIEELMASQKSKHLNP